MQLVALLPMQYGPVFHGSLTNHCNTCHSHVIMKIKISWKVVKGMQAAKRKHMHAALYYATMLTDISTINTK